ncbi:MAG: hypothetical protein NVSMB9_15530 [Isosphaeraceae bacterium]
MLDRTWGGAFRLGQDARSQDRPKPSRVSRRPQVECLESRQMLAASIAPIAPVTVPSTLGYQVPVNGSGSAAPSQTFTVSSDNPNIKASVATGQFWTINVSHTPANSVPNDVAVNGDITFQLFEDLTPKTAGLFESFIRSGYHSGKTIHRIADFGNQGKPADFVIQGGSPNGDGTGNSGLPGTPYGLELNQQLAFVEPGALAVAHSALPNSNDVQFFFTNGPQTSLDYQYTLFGQVVAGEDVIQQLTKVATATNRGLNEKSTPISPVVIKSATLSNTNPNGVIHIDATSAAPGETANITVKATDPSTTSTAQQSFQVTTSADTTVHPPSFTFKPLATAVNQQSIGGAPVNIQLMATNNNPLNKAVVTTYELVTQPTHGTITNFDPKLGTLVYTPNPGFFGTEAFSYRAVNTGGSPSPLPSDTSSVTINILARQSTETNAVRQIGNVLVVTPPPSTLWATNEILVAQTTNALSPANEHLTVTINGQTDVAQPLASSIDRIVVYGSKANDHIVIDPRVDPLIAVTLDGGHGGKNRLQAGRGPTREHGWFGQNTLVGGLGPNELIGKAGHVRFFPSNTTDTIFAGVPHPGYSHFRSYHNKSRVTLTPPGGTFYRFTNGKLVPIPTPPAGGHFAPPKAPRRAPRLTPKPPVVTPPTPIPGRPTIPTPPRRR